MEKHTIEKPENGSKNFSIIVPGSTYLNLKKISHTADSSLGAVCREILAILPPQLYTKLKLRADQERITVTDLCRRVLQGYFQ